MNVSIGTFVSPFSFFCKPEVDDERVDTIQSNVVDNIPERGRRFFRNYISDFNHGQYVAVMWNDKWVRGIVTMENQFLIWLVDYGLYLRPNDSTVITDLPDNYKKYPTKVFEASIHGVTPVDKTLSDDCQIVNEVTTNWNKGAIDRAQELISNALNKYFVPIAYLNTKYNVVVLGDLYLQLEDKTIVNIADQLQMWPLFLERNEEIYIKNLSIHYTSRRKHRASLFKSEFEKYPALPDVTLDMTLENYRAICAKAAPFEMETDYCSGSEDGTTVLSKTTCRGEVYRLTPEEIEKYSRMHITHNGVEYNVLNVLLTKLKDLDMCMKYQDHDLKGIGRACSRHRCVRN